MLKINDLRIDPASLGKDKLLVEVAPKYEYQNKVRTENIVGYKYVVALPAHGLEKISVAIDGQQLMENPERFEPVEFDGLEISAYLINGQIQITGKAKGIRLMKPETKA